MATIITNQATLNYTFTGGTGTTTALSNVASAVLNGQISIEKAVLSEAYRVGQDLTFIISVANNGDTASNNITVTDNLGTYTVDATQYTPLTFVGPARLLINGASSGTVTPTVGTNDITFELPSIPAGGNAQIIYVARPNQFANGVSGSSITNTATADCNCPCTELITDTATLAADDYAEVDVLKSITPNPVVCGEDVTFTFELINRGNLDATGVVLTDTFDPAITDITVRVNGAVVAPENYTYVGGVLTLPATGSGYTLTVPAATFTQNPDTGVVTVTPGDVQITVTGTI